MLPFAFILCYGGGITVGMITLRGEFLRENGWFQVSAIGFCLASGTFLNIALGKGAHAVFAVLPAGVIWGGSFAYFFASLVMRLRSWGMGDHKMRVEPTFDQAEAAEKRGDLRTAVELYTQAARAHPEHAETRRRLGEVYLRTGDADQAIMELRAAMGLVVDPEKKMTVAFRVTDLLVERKQDAFNAELILRSLEKDHAGTRVAELARARRERLGR